jgi:hypothetical protein
MFWVLPMQDQVASAFSKRVFYYCARKSQTLVVTIDCADRGTGFDTMLVSIGKADFFEYAIDGGIDLFDLSIGQGLVLTTRFTGMYRLEVFGESRLT